MTDQYDPIHARPTETSPQVPQGGPYAPGPYPQPARQAVPQPQPQWSPPAPAGRSVQKGVIALLVLVILIVGAVAVLLYVSAQRDSADKANVYHLGYKAGQRHGPAVGSDVPSSVCTQLQHDAVAARTITAPQGTEFFLGCDDAVAGRPDKP